MNIKRAKEEIKNTIEAYLYKDSYGAYAIPKIRQRPILLIGPPGVGKTQIMEQISIECELGLVAYTITHHTRQSAIGLPFIIKKEFGGKEYSVTEYTMSEIVGSIYYKIEETGLKEGILFIDEINCVSETLAPTMLQFLQCKTFGNHKIPEGWIIIAAGNPPEYNKSVREFDIVTLDRIKRINVEPDFSIWKEYAYQEAIHPAIIAYLDVKQQNFCQIEATVDGKQFATPRGWEDLSRLIEVYEKMDKKTDREVVGQYIQHNKIAKDFANYLELFYKYENDYEVDAVLSGTLKEALLFKAGRAPFDEKLSLIGLLLSKIGTVFRETLEREKTVESLMMQLKKFPNKKEGEEENSGIRKMGEITRLYEEEWKKKKTAGLLSRRQDHLFKNVLKKLEEYDHILKSEQLDNREDAWKRLRKLFQEENIQLEEAMNRAGSMLENAFNFMEAAFGDSQEMVIFVTQLNMNNDCIQFLQEYECERYYQYNKKLLFQDREDELLKRIES